MANSVDPDQTAPMGAVCSWSTLLASILYSPVMLSNYLLQTTSADDIFRCIFFLGACMFRYLVRLEVYIFLLGFRLLPYFVYASRESLGKACICTGLSESMLLTHVINTCRIYMRGSRNFVRGGPTDCQRFFAVVFS